MRNLRIISSLSILLCTILTISAQERIFRYANTGTEAEIQQTLTDTNGNTYTFGHYDQYFQYMNTEILSPTDDPESPGDVLLLKTNSAGKATYLNTIFGVDTTFNWYTKKMTINQKGEMAVFFTFYGQNEVSFNGRSIPLNDSLTTALVAKYSKSGFLSWVKPINTFSKYKNVTPKDIKLDEEGNVYLTGEFYGKHADFGNDIVLEGDSMEYNMFVAKYSTNKTVEWAFTPEIADNDTAGGILASHIELGPDGKIYVLGKNYGMRRFIFGPSSIQNKGIDNAFLTVLNNNGEPLWAIQCETYSYSTPDDISINKNGDIALTCFFMGTEFRIQDQVVNGNSTDYNCAVSHLTSQGEIQHIQPLFTQLSWVSDTEQEAFTHLTDSTHVIIALKSYNGSSSELVFLKLLMDGGVRYYTSGSSTADMYLDNAIIDKKENIFFLGHTYNDAPFTIGNITKNNDPNSPKTKASFIGKINSNGDTEYVYNKTNTDTTNVTFSGIGIDKFGNTYLSGQYQEELSTLENHHLGERFPNGIFVAEYGAVAAVNGKVVNMRGQPIPEGEVKLIGYTYRQKSPITDSTTIAPDGSFSFENVPIGKYLMVATTLYEDENIYLPTYFVSSGHWEESEHLVVTDPVTINNIVLIMTHEEKMEGNGTLTGFVNEVEENDIFKSTQQKPKRKGSANLAKSRKKSDFEIIAVSDLDEEGNFSFYAVDDGTYVIIIDVPGVPHEGYHEVTVEGGAYISSIDYLVGEETITMLNTPQASSIDDNSLKNTFALYPNPSNGDIIVESNSSELSTELVIQNIDGKLIRTIENIEGSITIQNLEAGIYFATFKTLTQNETIKFVILK